MTESRPIAIDCETHLFGPGNMAPRVVCLSWSDGRGSGIVLRDDIRAWWPSGAKFVGQNIAFDMACLLEIVGDDVWRAYSEDRVECTKVREKLLDIAQGSLRGSYAPGGSWSEKKYHLADLAMLYLDKRLNKDADGWRLRYSELDGIPLSDWPEGAKKYALDDAAATFGVWDAQNERSRRENYSMPTQHMEARAAFALHLTSVWGITTDHQSVRRLQRDLNTRMDELSDFLVSEGLMRRSFSSTFHVKRSKDLSAIRSRIEKSWPGGDPPRTPKGAVSTSKEVIEGCSDPALQAMVEFASLEKTASTYLSKMLEPVIHPDFDVLGAASSRTSCRNPNLQNQPRVPGIRECFRAREGYTLLACDYSSQEMRTFAQTCVDVVGKSRLAERYRQDREFDPHTELAEEHGATRQHCKIVNFGMPGGMGTKGLIRYAKGYGVDLLPDEADALRAAWFAQWPETEGYFRFIRSVVGSANVGTVVLPRLGFRRGLCGYTDASNSYFQSLAAHCSKAALFEVCRRAYSVTTSKLYDSRPVNFVHDEIMMETPFGHDAAQELAEVMVEEMERLTPDVPSSASPVLMRRWSKSAEPTYVDGRLIPWG